MISALKVPYGNNPVELAILAKWLLHETWLCSMQVLKQKRSANLITDEIKIKLQQMHTAFYCQAFYNAVQTTADIDQLLQNTRQMLSLLKDLDARAWSEFMMRNELVF